MTIMWSLGAKIKENTKLHTHSRMLSLSVEWNERLGIQEHVVSVKSDDGIQACFTFPKTQLARACFSNLLQAGLRNAHTSLLRTVPTSTRFYGINRSIQVWSRFSKSYVKFVDILFCFADKKNIKGL